MRIVNFLIFLILSGLYNNSLIAQDIFRFEQEGLAKDGTVIGEYKPTGRIPEFYEQLKARGLHIDLSLFS